MGYFDNPKATAETFDAGGWLHTGDQGFLDEEDLLTITDRIKEMVKVKGIGVAPAEIEDLLLGHPRIEDAAVMGIPDDYSGEVPKAFIVLRRGHDGTKELEQELIEYVRERKVRHKWVNVIEFVPFIPKSASGKILRKALKNLSKKIDQDTNIGVDVKEKAKL